MQTSVQHALGAPSRQRTDACDGWRRLLGALPSERVTCGERLTESQGTCQQPLWPH